MRGGREVASAGPNSILSPHLSHPQHGEGLGDQLRHPPGADAARAADGSTGWFVQGKVKLFRWSAGKYNQFDWTEVDRTIYSAGLEWTY